MKILVVDDSKIARKMTIKTIQEISDVQIEIIEATNGLEGLEQYKNNDIKLVFMDLTMPIMDGYESIQKIKEFDNNAKIVTVSADIQKGAMDRVRQLGSIGFIKKPINADKTKEYLEKIKD